MPRERLDRFFDVCEEEDNTVFIADLGSGAGTSAYKWFDEVFEDAHELGLKFTSVGVTTNDAGAVQSVLKWAHHLQNKVDYLIVLNELGEFGSKFEYWYQEPAVTRFEKILSPHVMRMKARIQELQAEMRNRTTTIQQIIDGEVEDVLF